MNDKRLISRNVPISIKPSANEPAEAFCNLGDDEQCEFLDRVGRVSRVWLPQQLEAVVSHDLFTDNARWVMRVFGRYAL